MRFEEKDQQMTKLINLKASYNIRQEFWRRPLDDFVLVKECKEAPARRPMTYLVLLADIMAYRKSAFMERCWNEWTATDSNGGGLILMSQGGGDSLTG